MKDQFQKTINYILSQKDENIKKLIALSWDKLQEISKYYYDWYKGAEESGYTESAEVNYLHFSIINEAIKIKKGNEE